MAFSRLLHFIYNLLYRPFAWSYDLVAWVVSLGHWKDWVLSIVPRLPGPRVLELGHGPGHLQAALASKPISVFGLDPSPQMGRLARRRLAQLPHPAQLVRANAQQLPFAAESFDQVAATFPSEYILDPVSLAAVRRALKAGGQLLVLPTARLGPGALHGVGAAFGQRLAAAGFSVRQELLQVRYSQALLLTAGKDNSET